MLYHRGENVAFFGTVKSTDLSIPYPYCFINIYNYAFSILCTLQEFLESQELASAKWHGSNILYSPFASQKFWDQTDSPVALSDVSYTQKLPNTFPLLSVTPHMTGMTAL